MAAFDFTLDSIPSDCTPLPSEPVARGRIEAYLARVDSRRREYAREYYGWRIEGSSGLPPQHSGLNPQSAHAMRKRIDQMLSGTDTYPALPNQIY
jgi:hypothetical protein